MKLLRPYLLCGLALFATASNPVSVNPSAERTIYFSGRQWTVKASSGKVGPGPNYFSDADSDVWVDPSGRLHLRIAYHDGKWWSTEVVSNEVLGHGKYTFTLASRVDQLDPNVVVGLFTWDTSAPEYNYREVDIEFAKWGNAADPTNSQYVVQPYDHTGNLVRFATALDSDYSTHSFDWQPDHVDFASHQGHGATLGDEITSWAYAGPDVPPEGTASGNARINFWLNQGQAPSDGQEAELIVESFEYEDVVSPILDHTATNQSVRYGSVSGDVADTRTNDGVYELLTEEESNGNPSKRKSQLEKTWQFTVRPYVPATFYANAWHPGSADGDDFRFSYSTDNSTYSPMFDVAGSTDDDAYQTFALGALQASTVYVRVEDTDRTPGHTSLDQLFVDHLFIRTESSSAPPTGSLVLGAVADGWNAADLTWTDIDGEDGYAIERSTDGGSNFVNIGSADPDVTTYHDFGLSGSTAYTYQVVGFNGAGSIASNPVNVTTADPPEATGIHLGGLTVYTFGKKRWKTNVAVEVHDQDHAPAADAQVTGQWQDGGTSTCTTTSAGECTLSRIWSNESLVSLTVVDLAKTGEVYNSAANDLPATVVIDKNQTSKNDARIEIPESLTIGRSYPNPFNPTTTLEFGLPEASQTTIRAYDSSGKLVTRLFDGIAEAGWHSIRFDAAGLPSGAYLIRIEAAGAGASTLVVLSK